MNDTSSLRARPSNCSSIVSRAACSERDERKRRRYAFFSVAISSFEKPRLFQADDIQPVKRSPVPAAITKGGTSFGTPVRPLTKACFPTLQNWWIAQRPERMAKSSTCTWPASVAPFAMITLLPTMQSCAMWLYAMMKLLLPTTVVAVPFRAPVDGHVFPDDVLIPYDAGRILTFVGDVLRRAAQGDEGMDRAGASERCRPLTETWLISLVPEPITAFPPTVQ